MEYEKWNTENDIRKMEYENTKNECEKWNTKNEIRKNGIRKMEIKVIRKMEYEKWNTENDIRKMEYENWNKINVSSM